jgi:3-hydroxybutyryl-CoA dehydrogenase
LVSKEVPGFIGNRLQAALIREALSLVSAGVATPRDIDLVIRSGFGRRYSAAGAFEVFDLAGWDLVATVAGELLPDIDSSTEIPSVLEEKLKKGEYGVKAGRGFYEWTPESASALQKRIAGVLLSLRQAFGESRPRSGGS